MLKEIYSIATLPIEAGLRIIPEGPRFVENAAANVGRAIGRNYKTNGGALYDISFAVAGLATFTTYKAAEKLRTVSTGVIDNLFPPISPE